jgi:hypothetical protein
MIKTVNVSDLTIGKTYYDRSHGEVLFVGKEKIRGIMHYNFVKKNYNVIKRTVGGIHREVYQTKPSFIYD